MEQIFKRNENENNELVSKLFLGIAVFLLNIWVFCWLEIFDFNLKAATLFTGISVAVLILPVLLIYVFHLSGAYMKYVLIGILSLLIGLCYCIFTFQMIILFLLPVLTAMLYMDKKLLYYSGAVNFLVLVAAHIVSNFFVLQPWVEPFTGMGNIVRFGILPRVMQLGVCFWILVILMNRLLSYMEQLAVINGERTSGVPLRQEEPEIDKQQFDACLERLTEREKDVFVQMLLGKTNVQIADTLCLSNGTVKNYVSAVYDKIGSRERNYLILKFGRFAADYDQSNSSL